MADILKTHAYAQISTLLTLSYKKKKKKFIKVDKIETKILRQRPNNNNNSKSNRKKNKKKNRKI